MDLNYPDWFDPATAIPAANRGKKGQLGLLYPVWTENKAKLIQSYLYKFVQVTKHGTYLDAFAGPQRMDEHEMWAAKLVLETRPRWLRKFYLFEESSEKIAELYKLRDQQPPRQKKESKRTIEIFQGDCNVRIKALLRREPIREKEAAFCLLDQWTFECHWDTVLALARHKEKGHKIELFYFLANGWIDRARSKKGLDDPTLQSWWGGDGWESFFELRRDDRRVKFARRFSEELGYKHVRAFPIYKRSDGGKTMYWMIHASDHDQAPILMHQAYRHVLRLKDVMEEPPLFECETRTKPLDPFLDKTRSEMMARAGSHPTGKSTTP